jgi:predicted aspartyl protease
MIVTTERQTRNDMGRIITRITVANALDATKEIDCEVLVDTGAAGLILPRAWKARLGELPLSHPIEMETADQRVLAGEICGPVRIQIEGFRAISSEVMFIDMTPENGAYEPLLGYIVLEQSQVAVDMVGHRFIPVRHVDLKRLG